MSMPDGLGGLRLSPKHRAAAQQLLAWLPTVCAPVGVVFAGSIVAGTAGPSSDLDVVVLHDAHWRQRIQRRFADTPAEIFVNSEQWLRFSMQEGATNAAPVMAHMMATGTVVMDRAGRMAALAEAAQQMLARGPGWSAQRLLADRYAAVCAVEDALDLSGVDTPDFRQLQALAVAAVARHAFLRRNMFPPRLKVQLSRLACIEPALGRWLSSALGGTPAEASKALEQAALAVLGSAQFFEWDSGQDDSAPGPLA
jgi:hypothetical protein